MPPLFRNRHAVKNTRLKHTKSYSFIHFHHTKCPVPAPAVLWIRSAVSKHPMCSTSCAHSINRLNPSPRSNTFHNLRNPSFMIGTRNPNGTKSRTFSVTSVINPLPFTNYFHPLWANSFPRALYRVRGFRNVLTSSSYVRTKSVMISTAMM